tara:strand:- start:26 stop:613 length:588 start_codon:yes stop_codon:yes gene_type:complete
MKFILVIISILFISSCGIYGNEKDIAGREGKNFLCVPNGSGGDLNRFWAEHNRTYEDTPAQDYLLLTIYAPDTAKIHMYHQGRRKWNGPGSDTEYLFVKHTFVDAILKMKKYGAVDYNKEWYKFGKWYFDRNGVWLVDGRPLFENQLPPHSTRLKCEERSKEKLEEAVEILRGAKKRSDKYLKKLEELQESQYKM